MRRLAFLLALGALAAAAGSAPGRAADNRECRGLQVCIPVAGPWVAVPMPAARARLSHVEYLLRCRKGSVVGGTDALVTDPFLDVSFLATIGSPVSPGVSTHESALFGGTYVGAVKRPSSFQPFLGCVPVQGGGGRSTSALPALRPGQPLLRRAREVVVPPARTLTAAQGCGRGERLVGSGSAVAFATQEAPNVEWLGGVRTSLREVDGRVVVTASRGFSVPPDVPVRVQIQALCASRG